MVGYGSPNVNAGYIVCLADWIWKQSACLAHISFFGTDVKTLIRAGEFIQTEK